MKNSFRRFSYFLAGFAFAVLWASASAATKIGLESAQPFVLALARFALASAIMLGIAHLLMRQPLPKGKQMWKQLTCYGLLNVGIYLGLYVLALQEVSAGLATLFLATNPVLIMLISALWYRLPLHSGTVIAFVLCTAGLLLAAYPLFLESYATPRGAAVLFLSMLSYSAGAIYFSRRNWGKIHMLTINGWQTLIGGAFLLPFMLFFFDSSANAFNWHVWGAVVWLAIPVSVFAVLLWLYLLRDNPVTASAWLFLCPIAGFTIAAVLIKEPLSWHTLAGVLLVMAGLYLVQRMKR